VLLLSRGQYWGETVSKHAANDVLLTLCHYAPEWHMPAHSHEQAGVFFLVRGDHEETDAQRRFTQPQLAGLWHDGGFRHEAVTGPKGMTGLNISISPELRRDVECPSESRLVEGPEAAYLGMRLALAVERQSEPEEIVERTWEFLGLAAGTTGDSPEWVKKARERVRDEFRGPLSLAGLARMAAVHPVYLARCYRRSTGRSVSQHVQELRLGDALARIRKGAPIGEAAIESGFSDQAHLSRIFARYLGVTPRRFQQG
jgi:AraC family transcriptional regulator